MTGPQTAEGWVLKLGRDRPDLSPSELHLLLVLAARHNRDHQVAHPKIELMSRETHLSTRQIVRLLNALSDKDRSGGQVLHISYGPLPIESRTGNPIYGNAYRFIDFDEIPEHARPRRQLGGRPPKPDDTMASGSYDMASTEPDDTGRGGQMTPGGGPDDTGNASQMTPANSPLYPVENPALLRREINPDMNPVRTAVREAPLIGAHETSAVDDGRATSPCGGCGVAIPLGGSWSAYCDTCRRARASPAATQPALANGVSG